MDKIPEPTIERLFCYYRCLEKEKNSLGQNHICSNLLGEKVGIKPALLRRDLSFLGHMGQKGKGYNRFLLKKALAQFIGLDQSWEIALIGAGNLGKALIKYDQFKEMGLFIKNIFENDLDKIGREIGGYIVQNVKDLKETIENKEIKIVIVATDDKDIKDVTSQLKQTNIRAVWNLSSENLDLGDDIIIIKEDLCCSLGSILCKINK